ncbi:3-phosphoshikimate 1-carboxyvinyltransferase [bacterium]|nr:3-phosphoshikimate 1-carboxyvinyltransferase [bacterium]
MAQNLIIDGRKYRHFKHLFAVPGDKSLAQRAIMLASMAEGESVIHGLPDSQDVRSVCEVMKCLGADIKLYGIGSVKIVGWGKNGPAPYDKPLNCGNSATCMRLTAGILASSAHTYTLVGDESLSRRPMQRLADVLNRLGAKAVCSAEGTAPMTVSGYKSPEAGRRGGTDRETEVLEIDLKVASAQMKTALLWAACSRPELELRITEPYRSRNHSEIMLEMLGVSIKTEVLDNGSHAVSMKGIEGLKGFKYRVLGDVSSAAYITALAVCCPHSHIGIDNLCINPTRMGFFSILHRMGARVCARYAKSAFGELIGGVTADYSAMRGTDVAPKEVPTCLDELPLLAVVASVAKGVTRVRGAAELRIKESDRISATLSELAKLGIMSKEYEDGFDIIGGSGLSEEAKMASAENPIAVNSHGDHRLAMCLGTAACITGVCVRVEDIKCCKVSFPEFWNLFGVTLDL